MSNTSITEFRLVLRRLLQQSRSCAVGVRTPAFGGVKSVLQTPTSFERRSMRPLKLLAAALVCVSFFAVSSGATAAEEHSLDALDALLSETLAAPAVPGAAVALFEEGEIVYARGFGLADVAAGRAVTQQTPFRAGSIGKSIVGVAVMMLVEEGKLALDLPLATLAPEIAFDNPWESTAPLRLVHLLEHSTGWADLAPKEFALDDADMTLLEGIHAGGVRVSRYPPGRYHAYSGAGHAIAAHIVEKTSGMPFASFVSERVFKPLAMTHAGYARHTDIANSYLPDGRPTPYQNYPLYPSGGLVASVEDLARFAAFLAGDGRAGEHTLLSPESLRRLERARSTLAAQAGLDIGYGLGVAAWPGTRGVLYGHGGAIDSFAAEYRYAPQERRGFAIVVNGGRIPPEALRALEERVAGPQREPVARSEAVPLGAFSAFAGTYQPIAQRNRLLPLVDSLFAFRRLESTSDGMRIDGLPWQIDVAGRLRHPDRTVPTLILVATPDSHELLGATLSYRKVSQASVLTKAAYAFVCLGILLAALYLASAASLRRRHAWPAVAALLVFLPVLGLAGVMAYAASLPAPSSIALFGRPSALSLSVFALTLLVPVTAASSLHAGLRRSRATRSMRGTALLASGAALIATGYLAYHGWLGLRTWAL